MMYIDIPWYIGAPLVAIEVLVLYAISKHYGRKLDEQQHDELQRLEHYWGDQS